jgi:hypothetical protein
LQVPLPRLVCAEYSVSKVVVEATLAQIQGVHDKDDTEAILAYIYTLHSDRGLRGEIGQDFTVYESNDRGRATFD